MEHDGLVTRRRLPPPAAVTVPEMIKENRIRVDGDSPLAQALRDR
jgi:hypothetical protein